MSLDAGRVGVRADQVDIHGRVTSPSFFNELLEDLPEWTDMPVWVNGTEELLPSNNSVPVTSPILADIAYPDIRRDNQYFTYRESPTPVDGLAKIKSIKGNTLVWNQSAQLGAGSTNMCTKTYDSSTGITTITPTAYTTNGVGLYNVVRTTELKTDHRYLVSAEINPTADLLFSIGFGSTSLVKQLSANTFQNISAILTYSEASLNLYGRVAESGWTSGTYQIKNVQCFDLTDMFGTEKAEEIYAMEQAQSGSGVAYFRSFYPLPYYQYDVGSLLPFRGEGLKTVGFNQWDGETRTDGYFNITGGWTIGNTVSSANPIPVFPDTEYYLCEKDGDAPIYITQWTEPVQSGSNHEAQFISRSDGIRNTIFRTAPNCHAIHINCGGTYGNIYKNDICINILSSRNGEYEPYTTHTTNLPISTYFPTGMKSAGNVYDELTPIKAKTRINRFVINGDSVTYYDTASSGIPYVRGNAPQDAITNSNNIKTVDYLPITTAPTNSGYIRFLTGNFYLYDSSFTDLATAKSILNANPVTVYYETATPVELPTLSLGE